MPWPTVALATEFREMGALLDTILGIADNSGHCTRLTLRVYFKELLRIPVQIKLVAKRYKSFSLFL